MFKFSRTRQFICNRLASHLRTCRSPRLQLRLGSRASFNLAVHLVNDVPVHLSGLGTLELETVICVSKSVLLSWKKEIRNLRRSQKLVLNSERLNHKSQSLHILISIELRLLANLSQILQNRALDLR